MANKEPPTLDTPGFEEIVQELIDEAPEMFGELRAALAMQTTLPPAAAETHLDLAIAYRQMGLVGDALCEAASALRGERQLTRPHALKALSILLDPRHLVFDLDELMIVLRETLFVH
ncbi:MAG: hypothetical protein GQE15_17685 [Archangiaceae bacterium]|nr:hypothetical protein [Archangiaceae bacterium]